jgi:hypothetical protein
MEKISSTLEKLKNSPRVTGSAPIIFSASDDFHWDHETQTVYYNPSEPDAAPLLLHETGHALLQHASYPDDISLLAMERDAWTEAEKLADDLGMAIDSDLVEETLDTYRDWLHARSTCPHCQATGVQESEKLYSCLACHHKWTVNEARICALRRHDISK